MATHLNTLASYVPDVVLRRLLDARSARAEPRISTFPGVVLFADISGFTALTERLAQQGPEGAEALSTMLNQTLSELTALITALGGDVVSFAGDALLAVWPASRAESLTTIARRAAQGSLALQALLSSSNTTQVQFAVRIGLGVGNVHLLQAGGVFGRWMWLTLGPAMQQATLANDSAEPGSVLLSPDMWELVAECSSGQPTAGGIRLLDVQQPAPLLNSEPIELTPDLEPRLRRYIPGAVLARIAAGQGNWLAELRRITVLFVRVSALEDPTILVERSQQIITTLQEVVYRFEGSINKFSVDEKGVALIAAMGLPPLSHEDDALRGVQTALAMQEALVTLQLDLAIGVTTGVAFSGEVGGERRREYTVLGAIVNMAARLMQVARTTRGILCDEATYQATHMQVAFESLPPMTVKGRSEPITVYAPTHLQAHVARTRHALVGRRKERMLLIASLQRLFRTYSALAPQPCQVLVLEGEAGIGKTRLVESLIQTADEMGLRVFVGYGEAMERTSMLAAWRHIFQRMLELDSIPDPDDRQMHLITQLAPHPDVLMQLPLLAPLLGMELPENQHTALLEGQARADALRELLLFLLRQQSRSAPVVVVLEDAHWLDSASWALLLAVSQHIPGLLLVMTTRPFEPQRPIDYERLLQMPRTRHVQIPPLSPEETGELASQRLGVASIPPSIATMLAEQSQGNPFFSQELIYALRDAGAILVQDGTCTVSPDMQTLPTLRLPDTIQGVVLSRIDRLPLAPQLTFKVASVIGQIFSFEVLEAIHPTRDEALDLAEDLAALELLNLVHAHPAASPHAVGQTYQFRHAIMQEALYHTLPLAQRRDLHRATAEWYLATFAEDPTPYAALLAYHFQRAGDERATGYFIQAGDQAWARHILHEAASYYTQALALITHQRSEQPAAYQHDSPLLIHLALRLGKALELNARHQAVLAHYETMAALARAEHDQQLELEVLIAWATMYTTPFAISEPGEIRALLHKALKLARDLEDHPAEARILWSLMLVDVFHDNDIWQALEYGEQSLILARCLNLREQIAYTLNDLSMVYRAMGTISQMQDVLEEAQQLWSELGNLSMQADNLTRLSYSYVLSGADAQALDSAATARRLNERINNPAGLASAGLLIGHVHWNQGRPEQAIEVMEETMLLGQQTDHLGVLVGTQADLGAIYASLGAFDKGMRLVRRSYDLAADRLPWLHPWVQAVLARLYLLRGEAAAAEGVLTTPYQDLMGGRETLIAPYLVALASGELALTQQDYARVITVVTDLLAYQARTETRFLRSDALYLRAQAERAQGDIDAAIATLQVALAETETRHLQRMHWQVLLALAALAEAQGHTEKAHALRDQARVTVVGIAETITTPELRSSFLSLPRVQAALERAGVPVG